MTDHGRLLRLGVNPGSGDRLDETADSAGLAAQSRSLLGTLRPGDAVAGLATPVERRLVRQY